MATTAAPAMTVVDMRELPGGPRAATLDNRWPQPLAPGARETAYDMEYAEVEAGQVMESDLAIERNVADFLGRAGLVQRQWSTASAWFGEMTDMSDVVGVVELDAEACQEEQWFVGQGSHSMGRGNGGNRAARASWARL